jgi:hypothetical protein
VADNKQYKLAIEIAGMIDRSLGEACNLTKKQLKEVAKEAAATSNESVSFTDAMGKAGSGIDGLWNGATAAVKTTAEALLAAGAAAGVAGGLIIHVGSDFESAFAGVKKTVDATDQQLADLEEGLREMAKNKPQTAVELAEIAEAAGQLGIHTENIEEFTNVMADLKVATNLGDEGASQFAKFANITGMAQDKFDRLGSSVVDLGNHMATTESDIVSMAMRLAGAGTQVKMNEADIMGFAAALSSVGIEAEMGGSAMSKMMIEMQLAVETGLDAWGPLEEALARTGHTTTQAEIAVEKGGNALKKFAAATGQNSKQLRESVKDAQKSAGSLQDFADVANMTAEEFATAFKDNAAKAMGAFISGLNDTDRLGQSAIVTLESMDIKEVRLRDTLLRAANASGLFNESIDMANRAFEENTALTKEADQRYATFESRLDMVKNRVTDMGITLYQDFREPLSDVLDVALKFTDEADLFDPAYIDGMAKNFQKSIPTVIRQIGEAKDAVVDFAGPFIELGDWMIENPDVVAGTLVGIGTAIASLKLAQTITNVTDSIKGLYFAMASNPVTAAIGLAALAGGAIVGISTKVKMANAELRKQRLDESFGTISLSLSELDEVTERILDTGNRKNINSFIDQMGKIADISRTLRQQEESLKKLNWKISMGMDLTDSDLKSYESTIYQYIESSISAVEQEHYAATIAVKTLFKGEGGEDIITSLDEFYRGVEDEVKAAGNTLGEAYRVAMEDEIITPMEQKRIDQLINNFTDLKNQVMEAESQAEWQILKGEILDGSQLTRESYENLSKRANDQAQKDKETYLRSYGKALTANNLKLDKTLSDPTISREEKDKAITDAENNELKQKEAHQKRNAEVEKKITDLQLEAVSGALSKRINENKNELINYLAFSGNVANALIDMLNIQDFNDLTKGELQGQWEELKPKLGDLLLLKKDYEDRGKEIPESLAKGIRDAATAGVLEGDVNALWVLLEATANGAEYQRLVEGMGNHGIDITEEVAKGIINGKYKVDESISLLYDHTQSQFDSKFGHMTVYGEVDFNWEVGSVATRQSSTANPNAGKGNNSNAVREVFIPAHAEGGIFDTPHYGVFAEAGPEAFIPLDGSDHAKSIWQKAGEALGVIGVSQRSNNGTSTAFGEIQDNSESKIVYAPVIHVNGSGEESVKKVLTDDFQRFESFMRQYKKNQKRLEF